jgi:exo-beta-1,3-glucanase (GH17 family)
MTALAYLRHPISLLVVVAVAIGFIWYVLGNPVQLPPNPLAAGEKLACVSYSPAAADSSETMSALIEAELEALAAHTACIRTYDAGAGRERIAQTARKHSLTLLQGVSIGANDAENRAEIERAVELAQDQGSAIRAFIVGSDVLTRRELEIAELAALIAEIQERTKLPVSYADREDIWLGADLIASTVDFITVNVPLYDASFPVAASDASGTITAIHAKIATRFSGKEILIGEAGWPGKGRMREAARPSPANQAHVIHEMVAAAKTGEFQYILFEGIDRTSADGAKAYAGSQWGFLSNDTLEPKFRWGGTVTNHPLWRMQAATGILLAFVVFAAGILSARSFGPKGIAATHWVPVAIVAMGAGAFAGWAVAELPVQSHSITDWMSGSISLALAFLVPPVAAAAIALRVPFEGFSAVVDPVARPTTHSLALSAAFLLILTVLFAIQSALVLIFTPEGREFPFAALTGPAVAFLVLSATNMPGTRRESYAEPLAAWMLLAAAIVTVVNESFLNWQALWFAAVLAALAAVCWRAPGVQRR